jgi:hypothetical protein
LQETIDEEAIKQIKNYLSGPWKYDWNKEHGRPDISDDDDDRARPMNAVKGLAFLWNSRRFQEYPPNNHAQFPPVRGHMVRRPFVGCFSPVYGPFCEIRLINIHLCNPNNSKPVKLGEYASVMALYENIYSDCKEKNNRAAYTLILGDYNIPLKYCHKYEEGRESPVKTFLGGDNCPDEKTMLIRAYMYQNAADQGIRPCVFVNCPDEKTTLIKADTYQKAIDRGIRPCIFANDFDHCSYNEKFFEDRNIKIAVKRINSVEIYSGNDVINHRKTISDHVPIKIELSLRKAYSSMGFHAMGLEEFKEEKNKWQIL